MLFPRYLAALAAATFLAGLAPAEGSPLERLSSLDLGQKAAQVLLIGIEGNGRPSSDTLDLLERAPIGGVLLFSYNLPSEPFDLGAYIAALQDAVLRGEAARGEGGIPLLVAIDHEGGAVFRFKGGGITRIPAPAEVAAGGAPYASLLGHLAGAELLALGVNVALAPVVELLTEGNERFLGSRSYGREASKVDAAAGAYIEGLQSEGVAAVAKHFPGNAAADPHAVLPVLDITKEVYERDYLPRFASAIANDVSAVMLSHVLLGALDPDNPTSLSPAVVRGELRDRLGFQGVAVTDDLGMKALSANSSLESSALAALSAGADLLMLTDMGGATRARDAIVAAVREGRLPEARLDEAVLRILELKARFGMDAGLDPGLRARRLAEFPLIVSRNSRALRAFRFSTSSN
jgi:beta-N-acetylhexosaminidase